jgi:hypothetical protein
MNASEIRSKMSEVHKEYSELALQLKELENAERIANASTRYKEYVLKVGYFNGLLYGEEDIKEVLPEELVDARQGSIPGIVYLRKENEKGSQFHFVLLKDKADYPRLKTFFERLHAADRLSSKEEANKEKYMKVLLGEEVVDENK